MNFSQEASLKWPVLQPLALLNACYAWLGASDIPYSTSANSLVLGDDN